MRIDEIETALALQGIGYDHDKVLRGPDGWFRIETQQSRAVRVPCERLADGTWHYLVTGSTAKVRLNQLAWTWELIDAFPEKYPSVDYKSIPVKTFSVIMGETWKPMIGVLTVKKNGDVMFGYRVFENGKLRNRNADEADPTPLERIHPMFWPEITDLYDEGHKCVSKK